MESSSERLDRADPSSLTTQALWREIEHLKELLLTKAESMQTAIDVAHQDLVRVPTDFQKAVGNLKDLHDQKFAAVEQRFEGEAALRDQKFDGVENQFLERDVRVKESASAATTAINAALQSQKEAAGEQAKSFTLSIDKSEKAVTDRINQQQTLFETTTRAQSDKIDDLNVRITRMESTGKGRSDMWGWVAAGIGLILSLYMALRPHA